MKRTNLNFVVDSAAFLGFVLLTTTGILMRYLFPPGSGHIATVWGLDRHEWGGIHFWIAVGFFAMLALHLVLHWRWIVCVASGKPSDRSAFRAGLGVVGLVTIVALGAAPLLAPIEKTGDALGAPELTDHDDSSIEVRGSMTLADVEQATGVPVALLVKSLGLPTSTAPSEKLGQLRREHGFEMSEVRSIVADFKTKNE